MHDPISTTAPGSSARFLLPIFLITLVAWPATPIRAQEPPVFEVVQELDFDEPEAWAMKYFTSASLMTSLGPVESRDPWTLDLGLELLQVPHLDQEQRTVGFGGFKEEDLNRSPVSARIRLALGLPGRFNLVLGVTPPVEVDGIEAGLFSLALERALVERDRWGLGLRAYGQIGEAEGDLTCTAGGDEQFPPGSPENPFGCEAPSDDTVTLEYTGVELNAHYRPRGSRAPVLHAGVAFNQLDMEFQVDALTFGFRDRTLQLAEGDTVSWTLGATWGLGSKTRLGLELFYSPLDIQRVGQEEENDPLFNLRALVRYRLR